MQRLKSKIKKTSILFFGAIFIAISIIFILNQLINWRSANYLYDNIEEIPKTNAALVLGTSQYKRDGTLNKYFYNRINAAVILYENDKVNYIIVSGDNRATNYNEPKFMRRALINKGVPDSIIYMDFAGFRTFDSVVRCHKVFGQNNFTVVSQKFHNQRAIYIAQSKNINAIGFNAEDVKIKEGMRVQIREVFARVKVFIDLITGAQPHFLGEPIQVGNS